MSDDPYDLRANAVYKLREELAFALTERDALRAENAQLVEQLSIRSESGMAKDMQEIMRVNNELLAVNNELSVAFKERDEALAENGRLREALNGLVVAVDWETTAIIGGADDAVIRAQILQACARAALGETDKRINPEYTDRRMGESDG